jgi:hypothetical protein
MSTPLVLIHGYSDKGERWKQWRELLITKRNLDPSRVHVFSYISLANEISIGDIAEGFNHALLEEAKLKPDESFDAIVHSTGILVIRAWLSRFHSMDRPRRLKHLVALAPATNGSPIAHKGRSWLGALFKGDKDFGPDFLEAGDQVLTALELASSFTWELAERDMFGEGNTARFKKGPGSPFVFTLCGDSGLGRMADTATGALGTKIKGSDGVVRWAGAALNCRRIIVDYTVTTDASVTPTAEQEDVRQRVDISPWNNQDNIVVLWPKLNHGTIMMPNANSKLASVVSEAFDVETDEEFTAWNNKALKAAHEERGTLQPPHNWQQLILRVVDERGNGVADWTVKLEVRTKNSRSLTSITIDDLHPFEKDKSYRSMHIDLTKNRLDDHQFLNNIESFFMTLYMNTNSGYVIYLAGHKGDMEFSSDLAKGMSELIVDLTPWIKPDNKEFVLPMAYTTTFVELRVNRDPAISEDKAKVCYLDT